jgi:hypothetical protein
MQITNGSKRNQSGLTTGRTSKKEKMALGAIAQENAPKGECRSGRPTGRKTGGRPTKRTPETVARIAEAISFGLTNEEAAAIVGIDDDTLTEWNKVPEFSGAIRSAVATRKLARLKRIEAGAQGWQGTAWALERQHLERLARPEIQLTLGRVSADSQQREHTLLWLNRELPSIERIVQSEPEERNLESETTVTDHRSLEELDLSFDPE